MTPGFNPDTKAVPYDPDGAKKLRAWLTMPQKDPNQTVTDFKVESPVPTRIEKDSEGNTFVYPEVANPPKVTRTCVPTGGAIDPSAFAEAGEKCGGGKKSSATLRTSTGNIWLRKKCRIVSYWPGELTTV